MIFIQPNCNSCRAFFRVLIPNKLRYSPDVMRTHRYTQWDGTQEVLFPTTDDLLKHLSDNLLEEEGVRRALRDLMRRGLTSEDGLRSVKGMRDFLREADEKRREMLKKYSTIISSSRPKKKKLLATNSAAWRKNSKPIMNKCEISWSVSGQVRRQHGRNAAPDARGVSALSGIEKPVAEPRSSDRSMQRPENLTGQNYQSMMDMLDRMNQLLQDENFLKNLPNMLDAAVDDLDNMLENLDSMTQEQLQQLSDMMSQMQQLEQLLNQYPFQGSQRMGMGEAGQILGQLRGLERFLRWGQRGMGDPSELDLEEIRQLLGEEAYEHLKYLKGVEQMLEEEGYIVRTNHGLKLTPRGIRKIGDKALREIFQMLNKSRWGNHNTAVRGSQGDRLEETKNYEYGDPMNINISETLLNALEKRKKGAPLKIAPEDFSVHRVEFSTASETALLIDVSYSMLMNDALHAGKKVALALHRLIETKYPQDTLHLVAFRSNAKLIKAEDLPSIVSLTYFMEHGTDIKEALRFARQLLGSHKTTNRQIILITDGEPTAATLDRGGRLHSGWGSLCSTAGSSTRHSRK